MGISIKSGVVLARNHACPPLKPASASFQLQALARCIAALPSPRSVPVNVIALDHAQLDHMRSSSSLPVRFFFPSPIFLSNNNTTSQSTYPNNPTNTSQWPPCLVSRPCFQCCVRTINSEFLVCCHLSRPHEHTSRVHHCHIHHQAITDIPSLQTSLPLSPPRSPSALSTTTPSPSPSSAPSSATPTARPRPPTPRRSSSSPRRLPPPPLPGVLPSLALPSSLTVLVPSSTPLALSPTRAPPTSER